MIEVTKLAAGEYEFEGGSISKDTMESNLWWLRFDGFTVAEDFATLKEAKLCATSYKEEV